MAAMPGTVLWPSKTTGTSPVVIAGVKAQAIRLEASTIFISTEAGSVPAPATASSNIRPIHLGAAMHTTLRRFLFRHPRLNRAARNTSRHGVKA
jgi:hypothetical protein